MSLNYLEDKYYEDTAEYEELEKAADKYERPIVTEITKVSTFWPAEKYHQDYFKNNPNGGYCVAVIKPKLAKAGLSDKPTDKKVKP
jgi:peptide-methionine (S)-S-oxide reductase